MGLKRKIDDEVVKTIHDKAWAKEIDKYGDAFKVPGDIADLIGERDRAMYCLQVWVRKGEQGSVHNFLRPYSLRRGALDWVIKKFCHDDDLVAPEKRRNQKERYRGLERHAVEHQFEQFTTAELAEIGEFSTQTIVKWLTTTRHYVKIKRGLYEARDPYKKKKASD